MTLQKDRQEDLTYPISTQSFINNFRRFSNPKYHIQSGFSFASVVADYGEPFGRTEHYGEQGVKTSKELEPRNFSSLDKQLSRIELSDLIAYLTFPPNGRMGGRGNEH